MSSPTPWVGYAAAVAATAVAALVRAAYDRWFGPEPAFLILLVLPVAVAAWLGGLRCGLFATALNAAVALVLFIDPNNPGVAVRVGVFVTVGVAVTLLSDQLHTARRRAEDHAREAGDRQAVLEQEVKGFSEVIEALPQMVWVMRPDLTVEFLNCRLSEFTGLTARRFDTAGWGGLIHPDDLPGMMAAVAEPLGRGEPHGGEYRLRHHSGEYRWVAARVAPVRGQGGAVERWVGGSTDIHDSKLFSDRLRDGAAALEARVAERTAEAAAQSRLLDAVLDALPAAVIVADATGRITRKNRACERVLGPTPWTESVAASVEWVGYWPESGRRVEPHEWSLSRALLRGESCPGEVVDLERFGDGCRRYVLNAAAPVLGPSGEIVAGVVAALDVTDQIAAERASRESERRFRAVFHTQFQFIGLMSPDGTLLEANRTALVAAGVREADVLGRPFWETAWWTHDPAQQERLREAVRRAAEGQQDRFEASHPRADGTLMWVDFSLTPYSEGGRVVLLIPEGRDITARMEAEAAVRASEERFRAFMGNAPFAAWVVDADSRVLYTNAWFARLVRLPAGVCLGKTPADLWPAEVAREYVENNRRVLAGGLAVDAEEPFSLPDGSRGVVHVVKFPVAGPSGEPLVGGIAIDVSARKHAEAALRDSEDRFRTAFDNAPIGMALVAPDGHFLRVNRRLCQIVGYAEGELLATDFQAITHPDDLNEDLALVRQVLEGAIPHYQMEKRYVHKDGHAVDAMLAVSLVRDGDGRPDYFISQIKDISERRTAQRALAANEGLLRRFITDAPVAVAMFDREMRYVHASGRWLADHGLAGREVAGLCHYDLFPALPDRWRAMHRRVLAGAVERCDEDTFPAPGGGTEWVEWECRPWHAPDGGVGGLMLFAQIISPRKRAEAALRASEERFRVLFEQSSDAHLIFTEGGGILDCNPAAVAMLRCPDKTALLRLHPAELSPEYQPDGRRSLEKCVEMDATARRLGHHRFDWDHRRLDGEVFPCEVTLTPVALDGQSALLVVWHELTERKKAEAAVRESEERFRAFMDNSPAIAWIKDDGGRYVYLSRRFEETYRVQLAGWQGKTDRDLWPAALADELQRNDRAVLDADRVLDTTERVPNPDGEPRVWRVQKFPLRAATGARYVGGTALDVTEEQTARDRIVASLKEKEVLLKEIHHRVKNNLQIISSLLHLQSAGLPDKAVRGLFEESRGRVKSMALVHERLYRSGDLAGVDLAEYARQLAADLFRAYKLSHEGVRLDLDVTAPPLPIDVAIPCGLLLNEMLSNCLKHAFQGRAEGVVGVAFRRAGGDVVLSVSDDGPGFPPGFDFRTSPSFGLQLIHTLAEQLNGHADLSGGPGATVAVTFPAPKDVPQ